MTESRIPVLVGCGQITQKAPVEEAMSPLALLVEASRRALADSGAAEAVLGSIDAVGVVRLIVDSMVPVPPVRQIPNPPRSLARALGARPSTEIYTSIGGNSGQLLVSEVATRIAAGEVEVALVGGAEALATLRSAMSRGVNLQWGDEQDGEPELLGEHREGTSDLEERHGLLRPINIYPLFENGLRGALGRSVEEHVRELGRLFSRFSEIAASNRYAWFPVARTAAEIATPSADNRIVGFPYTKLMNAIMNVDMAAAVVLTSAAKAKELGVDPSRFIYLHGCADASNHWYVSERVDYGSSPALRVAARQAFAMAGIGLDDIRCFDLYSCFPSAVGIACRELGLDPDDGRDLTVTGGLPYHGGPGNNYAMHAIAAMMERLRAERGAFGLVSADGYYVTKHSLGVYSTRPVKGEWRRPDRAAARREIDALAGPEVVASPRGRGRIETYTVVNGHSGPRRGIVIGRLEDGRRFLANTASDRETLERMMRVEMLGRRGLVSPGEEMNRFDPDWD